MRVVEQAVERRGDDVENVEKRGKGRPFAKGNKGRPKGARNCKTREFAEFCRDLTTSEAFRLTLQKRFDAGTDTPAELGHVLAYGLGKPPDPIRPSRTL